MHKIFVVLIFVLLLTSLPAESAVRVAEFKGTSNTTTATFTVKSPWILDWRLDGDYEQMMGLEITLVEAKTGRHVGRVLYTKRRGNGVKLFHSAGNYRLRVSSSLARWTVKIDQLTRKEAESYTAKEK